MGADQAPKQQSGLGRQTIRLSLLALWEYAGVAGNTEALNGDSNAAHFFSHLSFLKGD